MNDLVTIDRRKPLAMVLIILAMVAVLFFSWFSIRNQLGNLLSTLTQESDPNLVEVSKIANSLAPTDPAGFALAAAATDTSAAVDALEKAVRNAPHDFRWRIELGRAYEQNGQTSKAEEQLLAAVALAPNYSFPRWHLGNFYVRQEQPERAFAELKIAAENSPTYREQVFSLLWDYSGRDPAPLEQIAGENPDMRARLAYFFAARGKAPEALRNWNRLNESEKGSNTPIARSIALGLFDQKHFAEALEFARQYGSETEAVAGAVTNGGFENTISENEESRFGWTLIRETKLDALPDAKVRRTGNRSLRLNFKAFSKPGLSNVLQTVVVEPGARYRLTAFARTENLRSAGLPLVEILSANDERSIAFSKPVSSGTNDWQELSIEFLVPKATGGITIRTVREFCGDECPITGILWYDDFVLTKV